ncbi:MAG: GNAT family N-acetyltransferase [Leptolyngbya sp. SIO3F4]|nr:GNAT family N-acetyltransferase [Leptolyngbya sp. SIO3F4]
MSDWPEGYQLVKGSSLDRARLLTTMGNAYLELGATQLGHLAKTIDLYLEGPSALWWLQKNRTSRVGFTAGNVDSIGCIWLGASINQLTGGFQAYLYLVYISPDHRRQGLGRKLMQYAKTWAIEQGYKQLALQVFCKNLPALRLYENLGYQSTATLMTLNLES